MVSAVSGMSVAYDKEGVDPCMSDAHHFQRIAQPSRRRLSVLRSRKMDAKRSKVFKAFTTEQAAQEM
jgi:hypothetical protein